MKVEATGSAGSGSPPVVLVHGFGANRRFWRKWTPSLSERAQVFNVDLVEPAPDGVRDHSPTAQASRLASFLRSLETDVPPVIVGHSLGGGIGLAACLELLDDPLAPAPLSGLVLVSGAILPQPLPRYMSLARRRGIGELFLLTAPPRPILRFGLRGLVADPRTVDDAQIEAYREPLRDRATRKALLRSARALDLEDARPIVNRLHQVRVPTLLIWGSEDRIVLPDAGRRIAEAIPRAEFVILEGVGHLPPEEAPDRSLAPLLGFLETIGRAPVESAP